MKKYGFIFGFAIFILIISFKPLTVNALTNDIPIEEQLENTVNDSLDNLDTNALDRFINSLESGSYELFGSTTFSDKLNSVVSGEFSDGYDTYFTAVLGLIGREMLNFMPTILAIVIVAIMSGLMLNLRSGFLSRGMGEIMHFVFYSVIIVIILNSFMQLLFLGRDTMDLLKSQMNLVFPILLTMIAGLNGVVSVKVYQPAVAVLSTTIMNIITMVIFPLFIITTVLSVVSNLSTNVKLDNLTSTLKSISHWIIGVIFTIFLAFLSIQGITASVHDGVSIRAAKYAISNSIPILGGYIKDGFDLILSSTMLIKNAVGATGLILLIATIALPIIKIIVFMFGLKITSAIIEPMTDKRISGFINSASKNITMIIVSIIGTSFMYFITVMLMISSANIAI